MFAFIIMMLLQIALCCVTGDYRHIVIVSTHQLMVCNKFALFRICIMLRICLRHSQVCSCSMLSNDSADVPYWN